MFDLGGTELLLIGIVALVVVGPKELPTMFRAIGMLTGRAREMAREFTSAMNSAADQSGLQEINKTIKAATNPAMFGMNKVKEATGLKAPPVAAKPVVAAPAVVAEGDAAGPVKADPAYVPNGATEKLAEDRAALKAKLAEEAAARKLAKANAISNPPGVAPIAVPAPVAKPATVAEPVAAAVKKPAKATPKATAKPKTPAKPKPKADPAPPAADDAP